MPIVFSVKAIEESDTQRAALEIKRHRIRTAGSNYNDEAEQHGSIEDDLTLVIMSLLKA